MDFQRVDLHIVTLLAMFLFLFSAIVPTLLEQIKAILGLKLVIGVFMFLMPQGIILIRVVKRKGFKFRITDKEYFYTNELLALCFVFISCSMIEVMSTI